MRSKKDFTRFLKYAVGSASELEYHFIFGRDTKVITERDYEVIIPQIERVRKMLHGLLKALGDDAE